MANDSPLSPPQKGDPISAAWAGAITDAINARGTSDPNANGTATPFGTMLPADTETLMEAPGPQAMPFDAAIIREGADGDALYMALPNAPDYVFDGANAVAPSPAQTMGTAQNAYVRIEAVTNGTARYVSLALTPPDPSTTPPTPAYWRLFVAASPLSRPGWADPTKPVVLLAGYNIAADDSSGLDTAPGDVPSLLKGLVQYHRGTINLGEGAAEKLDTECTPVSPGSKPGQSIQRYYAEGDENTGALQIYKFPDNERMTVGSSATLDDLFDFVVRDKTATRPKVNYVLPSAILGGTFTAVTNAGIADGYFYIEKTTFTFTGNGFTAAAPVRTNIFQIENCA